MFSAATEREEFREGASVGVVVTAARRTAAAVGRRRRRGRHDVHVVCRRAPRNLALSQSQRRVDVNTGATGPKLTLAARGQSRGTAAGTTGSCRSGTLQPGQLSDGPRLGDNS